MKKNINHPEHYNKGKIEVIEVIEDWKLNFHLGNAIKYISRSEHKDNYEQDIEKAIWYLRRSIQNRDNPEGGKTKKEYNIQLSHFLNQGGNT